MKLTTEELIQILENHRHWLNKDSAGWEDMRADLQGAYLRSACLWRANLEDANLESAYLEDANLESAYLEDANLESADLRDANLKGAYLWRANLESADLRRADLESVYLRRANLESADLRDANLKGADLRSANLKGADLRSAYLWGANLRDAEIDATTKIHVPYACPETGSFIGWEKASNKIVCLEIQEDALRSSATNRKCRCSKAKVLNITNLNGTETDLTEVASNFDKNFIYRVGEVVEVKDFDTDRWNECSTGVHFFITRQEAVEY